ncbi:MAG: cytochrome d ubiquinol oxidase subunit II [bacterium]
MDLNLFWYLMVGVLLTGYAVLDGFDLGVGALHLLGRNDQERRIMMNSIGPVWDGNEVWLVTAGGALFAAFPHAYATAFSGFYLAFMLLLVALIFRAVAIEFRSKRAATAWRSFWDWAFSIASIVASLLFGVAVGNMIIGLPIGRDMEYSGGFLELLGPYPLMVGAMNLAMFAMHGAIYLYMKTEGGLQGRVRGWCYRAFGVFLIIYALTTAITILLIPSATRNFSAQPWAWIVVALLLLALANIPRCIHHGWPGRAFISSSCAIAAMVFLFGVALFPNLVISTISPEFNLTAYNAASSEKTLAIMRNIAFIGLPFVLAYTALIYWIFRGKVRIMPTSY